MVDALSLSEEEEAQALALAQFQFEQERASVQPEPSMSLTDRLAAAPGDIVRGGAQLAAFVPDLVALPFQGAYHLATGDKPNYFPMSQQMERDLTTLGMPRRNDIQQRVLENIIPINKVGMVGQAVSGAGAGIGSYIAENYAPDSWAAQYLLPLLGAVSPTLAKKTITGTADALIGSQSKKAIQADVGEAIAKLGVDEVPDPIFSRQTTAEVLADAGKEAEAAKLAALELEAGAKNAAEYGALNADRVKGRFESLTNAVPEGTYAEDIFNLAKEKEDVFKRGVTEAKEVAKEEAITKLAELESSKAAARGALPKAGSFDDLGKKARELVVPYAEEARKLQDDLYGAVNKEATVPAGSVVEKAWDLVNQRYSPRLDEGGIVARDVPEVLKSEIGRIAKEVGWENGLETNPIRLQRAIDLRGDLFAKGQAIGGKEGAIFKKMAHYVTEAIENASELNGDLSAAERATWREANNSYREYATLYRRGPVGETIAKGDFDIFRIGEEKVPNKLLLTGRGIDTFLKATKNHPQAIELAESAIMRQITDEAGLLNVNKAKRFLSDKRELLQRTPQLTKRLADSINKVEAIDVAKKQIKANLKETLKSYDKQLSGFGKSVFGEIGKGGREAEAAITSIMKKPTKEVRAFLEQLPQDARETFGKAVYSNLIESAMVPGREKLIENTLSKSFFQNEEKLALVLGDDLFNILKVNLGDYVSQITAADLGKQASRGGSITAQKLGKNVERALGREGRLKIKIPPWIKATVGISGAFASPAIGIPLILAGVGIETLRARSASLTRDALYNAFVKPSAAREALDAFKSGARQSLPEALKTPAIIGARAGLLGNNRASDSPPQKKTLKSIEMKDEAPKPSVTAEDLKDAVIYQESRGREDAIGPETKYGRAKGKMQLLDSTGRELFKKYKAQLEEAGIKSDSYDPLNGEQNEFLGTKYLGEMLQIFKEPELALAAYNAGMGNVRSWIKRWGNNWDRISSELEKRGSFKETRNYVPEILSRHERMKG